MALLRAVLLLVLLVTLSVGSAALAAGLPAAQTYRCDGEPLTAELIPGPMDDPTIPDPSTAPVPVGGSVLLHWHDLNLQLPRTNNAGAASFSDGKWWWSLEDPNHPRFLLRRGSGEPERISCELAG